MSILIKDFNYKRGIRRYLEANDVTYKNINGVVTFSDEVKALQLIAAYDPLPTVKQEAKTRILVEAAKRVNAIYPHVDAEKTDVVSFYNYTIDMYSGGLPLPERLQSFKNVRDIALTKISEVSAMTDHVLIEAYNATVGW